MALDGGNVPLVNLSLVQNSGNTLTLVPVINVFQGALNNVLIKVLRLDLTQNIVENFPVSIEELGDLGIVFLPTVGRRNVYNKEG